MDKFILIFGLFLALIGAFFYGHEFGMVSGSLNERIANKQRLDSCQKIIAGNMYEVNK